MRPALGTVIIAGAILLGVGAAGAAPGDLDPTFGTGGKVLTDFGSTDEKVWTLLAQPGGTLLAAGYLSGDLVDFGLARYLSNGTLDPSFGTGGSVKFGFSTKSQDYAFALARTPGQKLVVAGITVTGSTGATQRTSFAVARLLLNGKLDPTFSGDGRATTTFGFSHSKSNAAASSLVVQPHGEIVVAGWKTGDSGKHRAFALVRYRTNGALDATFGTSGKVVTDLSGSDNSAGALLRQHDGKLVALGTIDDDDPNEDWFAAVRYLPDGTLDSSFGTGGKVWTLIGPDATVTDAALQADGKIVVFGGSKGKFALMRFTPSGALDSSFGTAGKVISSFGGVATAEGVEVDPDGRIVTAGTLKSGGTSFLVARYTPSGKLDTSFTLSGVVRVSFGPGTLFGGELAIQSGTKIVVGGYYAAQGMAFDFALARLQGGTPATPPPPPPPPSATTAAKPAFSIADVRIKEGTRAATTAVLTVTLSSPAPRGGASVDYATRDGSAVAGRDYLARNGTLRLDQGDTSAQIRIPIVSDATREDNETFTVRLNDPDNATIDDGRATVTILDDDR